MPVSALLKFKSDVIRKLEQIFPLESMAEKDIQKLLRVSNVKKYQPGQTIFEEGTTDSYLYYLVSGRVKVVKKGKVLLYMKRTGDIFGEISAIDGFSRSASVIALEETVCVSMDVSRLEILSDSESHVFLYILFRNFSEVLAARLRATTRELLKTREELDELRESNAN